MKWRSKYFHCLGILGQISKEFPLLRAISFWSFLASLLGWTQLATDSWQLGLGYSYLALSSFWLDVNLCHENGEANGVLICCGVLSALSNWQSRIALIPENRERSMMLMSRWHPFPRHSHEALSEPPKCCVHFSKVQFPKNFINSGKS
jgi:hypothetical protein